MKRIEYNGHWLSFYGNFKWWHFEIGPASYFDRRAQIHTQLTSLVGLLCLPFFGLTWWVGLLLLFPWGQLFLHLPIYSKIDQCEYPSYGFYLYHSDGVGWERPQLWESLWLCLGWKKYCINMPWSWDWVRTSAMRPDGTWVDETLKGRKVYRDLFKSIADPSLPPYGEFYDQRWNGILFKETYPYRYTLENGTVQERLATVRVEEREWRYRALKWSPWPRMVRRTINVDFDKEVGERTGSWKGGTTGCGWRILPNETPRQALMNMEIYRKFN